MDLSHFLNILFLQALSEEGINSKLFLIKRKLRAPLNYDFSITDLGLVSLFFVTLILSS